MDMGGKDRLEYQKGNEDLMSSQQPDVSSEWQFSGSNIATTSMASTPSGIPMAVGKVGLIGTSSCSSASMIDSFCPTVWDHSSNTENLGLSGINLQNGSTTSNTLGIGKVPIGNISWAPPNSMVQGVYLPSVPGILPQSLSHFPTDSGFIERAARFSCFSRGNFGDSMNPFGISECLNPHARGSAVMHQAQHVFAGNGLKSLSGGLSRINEVSIAEPSKDVSLSVEQGATDGSLLQNERKNNSFVPSHDEAKQGVGLCDNESDEAEFSGSVVGVQEETCTMEGAGVEPSPKALGFKKRKRGGQDNELGQVNEASQPSGENVKDNIENQQKGDQTPTSTNNKAGGKNGKQGSQASASDSPKQEYIHVRARRGQATNSHSLAERVRREKISERMKFLQDLVPGCSKVTGKAVMLDEIINYVQSLQRQVEFLSMKLAAVNPRLDCNLEGLLAKDILQSRAGPSSTLACPLDMAMPFPPMHLPQPGLIQKGPPGMANFSDALQRSIKTQLTAMSAGYKEPTPQVPNMWGEDELHNVVQMGFNSSAPSNSQDLNESMPPGHEKVEL